MAKIITITNADGSRSYGTHVNVKPFKRTWRSFATKKEATDWCAMLTAQLRKQRAAAGTARPDLPALTLADLNAEYLKDPETQRLATFADYQRQLEWWTLNYGTVKVLDFGVMQVREARGKLIPGRQNATVVRYLSAQRSAWNWGRECALVPKDHVWPPGAMLTEPKARVRYLSDDELRALLNAAKANSATVLAAVTLALATGMRLGEQMRLKWSDVDFERSRIRLLRTKNGTARSVHLPAIAAQALKSIKAGVVVSTQHVFLNPNSGQPLSGQGLDRLWRMVRIEADLKDFRWHDLRHSAASMLAQNGATLLEIGSVLGHQSAGVTLKYAHLVDGAPVTGHAALDAKLRSHQP